MINKEFKQNMKKAGARTLCAIMIASTIMTTAAPAYAAERKQPQESAYERVYEYYQENGIENIDTSDLEHLGIDREMAAELLSQFREEAAQKALTHELEDEEEADDANEVDEEEADEEEADEEEADEEDAADDFEIVEYDAADDFEIVEYDAADEEDADDAADDFEIVEYDAADDFEIVEYDEADEEDGEEADEEDADDEADEDDADEEDEEEADEEEADEEDGYDADEEDEEDADEEDEEDADEDGYDADEEDEDDADEEDEEDADEEDEDDADEEDEDDADEEDEDDADEEDEDDADEEDEADDAGDEKAAPEKTMTAKEKKAAEKEKKKKEAARTKMINKAGAQLGKFTSDLLNGKFQTQDEALHALGMTTLKFVNDTVIKNIPYVGTFLNTIIKGQMGGSEEESMIERLDNISDKLDTINQTIIECTKDITDGNKFKAQNDKINDMNTAYNNFDTTFRNTDKRFNEALRLFTDEDSTEKSYNKAHNILEDIYSTKDKTLLNVYTQYINTVTSTGHQISAYRDLNPDIMEAFKCVVTHDKTGDCAIVEFENERKALIDNVEATGEYGYSILNMIITSEHAKYAELEKNLVTTINELKEQRATLPTDQREEINNMITDLSDAKNDVASSAEDLNRDLERLNKRKECLDEYIQTQRDKVAKDREVFKDKLCDRKTYIRYADHTFRADEIEDMEAYINLSADKTKMEYRDMYGNLIATRDIAKQERVGQYDVKAGNVYRMKVGGFFTIFGDDEVLIKVKEVKEIDMLIGSVRTVFGWQLDEETGRIIKEGRWEIGGNGAYNAWERKIGNLKFV